MAHKVHVKSLKPIVSDDIATLGLIDEQMWWKPLYITLNLPDLSVSFLSLPLDSEERRWLSFVVVVVVVVVIVIIVVTQVKSGGDGRGLGLVKVETRLSTIDYGRQMKKVRV